ncbi:pro-sigmaK processing inhibitor BofA family protein [Methanofollis fontis]|uniref:SigmaK-factor processing regulatory BofA n=1 Tax=Methanofollis fontis TaxID=2052832 RepID=A0A483CKB3_9EURY|nr:pro-sigmaK processing inhibitor BofA family protein [Methanofollis fontis]TAJ43258.1 sigmaK-factor processing regulatory BofA [Methanofollis fontis]
MFGSLLGIVIAILVAVLIYHFLKKAVYLVINAVVGVVILFLINALGIMHLLGKPDVPIDLITILISALGGIIGVVIVVLLHLIGVSL